MGFFHITPMAARHLTDIANASLKSWGRDRAVTYVTALKSGFQHIADRHQALPRHTRLTGGLTLRLHRVGSHYVVFAVLTNDHVAITAVLHERMDVSTRLREMQVHTDRQVGDIRASLLRSQFKPD